MSSLSIHYTTIHSGQPLPTSEPPIFESPTPSFDEEEEERQAEADEMYWHAREVLEEFEEDARRREAELAEDPSAEVDDDERSHSGARHRTLTTTSFPEAGWACDSSGKRHEEQHPPPRPLDHSHLLNPEAPFFPFSHERQYNYVKRTNRFRLTVEQVKAELDMLQDLTGERPITSRQSARARELTKKIPYGKEWTEWQPFEVSLPGDDITSAAHPFLSDSHTLYTRNTRAVLAELLRKRSYQGHQYYGPLEVKCEDGTRFVTEPHTGTAAWDFQSSIPPGSMGIRINLASDATPVTMLTGNLSYHPVYMSTSVNASFLHREHGDAVVVVGFLPALKNTSGKSHAVRQAFGRYSRMIRHHCMKLILEPLRTLLGAGELVETADGWFRHGMAYLGSYAVDHPESLWLNSVRGRRVVCCDLDWKSLGKGAGEKRHSTSEAQAHRAKGWKHAKAHGLNMETPFFHSFGINGHDLCIADPLHQVLKGAVKDITIEKLLKPYLLSIAGSGARQDQISSAFAKRMACMPVYPSQRKFNNGIDFVQWTGADTRAVLKVITPVLFDLTLQQDGPVEEVTVLDEVTRIFAYLNIMYMLASSQESTGQDRAFFQDTMERFMEHLPFCFDWRTEFSWPRLHALFHYPEWIEKHGVPSHSDTATYETAHIRKVKQPYRDSNHCNATSQVLAANSRNDALACMHERLESAGILVAEKSRGFPTSFPKPYIKISARGQGRLRSLDVLAAELELPHLRKATQVYMKTVLSPEQRSDAFLSAEFDPKCYTHSVIRATFPVYAKPVVLDGDSCKLQTQYIYAKAKYNYRDTGEMAPRYDVVMSRNKLQGPALGLRAYDFFRVRTFFSFIWRRQRFELCLGEEIELMNGGPPNDALMQPLARFRLDSANRRRQKVFNAHKILRSVHLQPLFRMDRPPESLSHKTVLAEWKGPFVLALFTDQHMFRTFFLPMWSHEG